MNIIEKVRNEPVLVSELVKAVLALIVAFGVGLSGEQVATIMALVGAVLAIVARRRVTPVGRDIGEGEPIPEP